MIITTTDAIEGRRITQHIGIVAGEAVLGANIFRDLFASIRDIVGGRTQSYQKVLQDARQMALTDMMRDAAALGADAIVGVDLDYETMGESGTILMVSCNGTAVKLGPANSSRSE